MSVAVILALGVATTLAGVASGAGAEALLRRSAPPAPRWRVVLFVGAALLVTGAVAWRFAGRLWLYPLYLLLAVVAVPLSALDVAEHRIPDAIVRPAFAATLALLAVDCVHTHQISPLIRAVLAAIVVDAVALASVLLLDEAMGWADGKLLALSVLFLGYLGWGRVLAGLLLAFAAASTATLVLIMAGGRTGARRLAFAPYLLGAALAVVLAG